MTARRLTQQQRQAQIVALVQREGTVRIAALADLFDVTAETARRDLDDLAQAGALNRTYGGGASRSLTEEPGIGERGREHAAERARVGAAAAALVEAGDALMIDCGSTTTLFAHALAARGLPLTVLTNCLLVARALGASTQCRVLLCPGEYVLREGGVYGADTLAFLRGFRADKTFIGAGGMTEDGVMDADSASCAVKRAMIGRAGRTLLVADSSKYGVAQFEKVCAWSDIDDLVSEARPEKPLAAALRRAGTRVVVAT
ncbi:MAG: DeoR/GlpR transcriptional regulator [Burkholderiales bacterium]|nr:DeoR/GlpR transcriptional regulator [Burkholderiales bacterium]